jgi:transposase
MDRASVHREKVLRKLADKAKVNLLLLPAYSQDLNRIEPS